MKYPSAIDILLLVVGHQNCTYKISFSSISLISRTREEVLKGVCAEIGRFAGMTYLYTSILTRKQPVSMQNRTRQISDQINLIANTSRG